MEIMWRFKNGWSWQKFSAARFVKPHINFAAFFKGKTAKHSGGQTWADCMAEEEGFDFAQYAGGTRWHALARYTRNVEDTGFTIPCAKRGLERFLIRSFLVATVAR